MKKFILLSAILTLSGFASQAVVADNSVTASNIDPSSSIAKTGPSWLGVWIDDLPLALGSHLSPLLKKNQGLIIEKISPDSPADKAGLQTFDIITRFNDQEIFSKRQLTQLIQSSQPGTAIELSLIRQGKLMTQKVTLAAFPKHQPPLMHRKHHPGKHPMPPQFGHGRPFMPHPWMKEPFFNRDFDRYFQQRFKQPMPNMPQESNWAQFESIQIESIGKDTHRAEVKFEDSQGNKKHFVFEGKLNQIRDQIMAQENMEEDKKQSLLQALDMNSGYPVPWQGHPGFMAPGGFNDPVPGPNWLPNQQP